MTEEAILKQVEFYFSDSNYRRDKFLLAETEKYEGGYIPFEILFKFKKLAALTTDPLQLQKALMESNIVQLNESKDGVARKYPLPAIDDSKQRTLVFAGLGREAPLVEDIKNAIQDVVKCEILYIQRQTIRKQFNGVIHIEFATIEDMERVQQNVENITIQKHIPSVIPYIKYEKMTLEDKIEFDKSIKAILLTKDVLPQPKSFFYEALEGIWNTKETNHLRPRIKYIVDTKTLYLSFSQIPIAKQVQKLLHSTHPLFVNNIKMEFELITDAETIANRPRQPRLSNEDKKRKRGKSGKVIHLSNIGPRARLDEIKKILTKALEPNARLPYIEFDGLNIAKFVVKEDEEAQKIFNKLENLSDDDRLLAGQTVKFHILDHDEQLQLPVQYEEGLIIHFEGIKGEISRDVIKDYINEQLSSKHGNGEGIAFIKYQMGNPDGFLRVTSPAVAKDIIEMFTNGLEMNGHTIPTATIVTGEVEKKFWEDAQEARQSRFKQSREIKSKFVHKNKRGRRH